MDTDDLSKEAYAAIIIEAEKFKHNLTLQFGLRSYHCKNVAEYLNEAKVLIEEIKGYDRYDLDDIFFGNPPTKAVLRKVLDKISSNITEDEKIPENIRHYDF